MLAQLANPQQTHSIKMNEHTTELADQLLHRIHSKFRPSIAKLSPEIIPNNGPHPSEIIEINGDTNVGKSMLLMEFIGQAIIPIDYGGRGANVILIDLTCNFPWLIFPAILEKHILHYQITTAATSNTEDLRNASNDVKDVIHAAMKNLETYQCFSTDELERALVKIDSLLPSHQNVSLLAIESLGTFYWNDISATQPIRMDAYLRNLVKTVKKVVDRCRITLMYTRPAYLQNASNETGNLEKADYQIELKSSDGGNFNAAVLFDRKCFTRKYSISNFGIQWIYRGNTQND